MVAIAAMQCVEKGLIGLDDHVGRAIPWMNNPAVIEGFEEDGAPRTREAKEPITLRYAFRPKIGCS